MKPDPNLSPGKMDDPFFTVREVAEIFSCSPETVKNWIKDGILKSVVFGERLIRIRRSEIERFGNERAGQVEESKNG